MVKICKKSQKMIEEIFSAYKEKMLQKDSSEIVCKGRIVIHTYPTKDTINDNNDNAEGFRDSLFFEVKIYDTQEGVYYKLQDCDCIQYYGPIEQRIFKDGSTMVTINGEVSIHIGQAVIIEIKDGELEDYSPNALLSKMLLGSLGLSKI